MTPAVALFLAIVSLAALGFVGAIAALIGLALSDLIARRIRRIEVHTGLKRADHNG